MIGQEKLVEKFNTLDLGSLPHSIILAGELGSGRHTLIQNLADRLGVQVISLDGIIKLSVIEEIQALPFPTFYIIDGVKISQREEGVLLKFLEEPPEFAYTFILCENSQLLLNTIVNRCQVFQMDHYTKNELVQFCSSNGILVTDDLLSVCTTPGKILSWKDMDIAKTLELCDNMLARANTATPSNVLSIADKIDFTKDKAVKKSKSKKAKTEDTQKQGTEQEVSSRINKDLFISCLAVTAREMFLKGEITASKYYVTNKFITSSYIPYVDLQKLFDFYLCGLMLQK